MLDFRKYSGLLVQSTAAVLLCCLAAVSCDEKLGQDDAGVSLQHSEVTSDRGSQFVSVIASGDWTLSLSYMEGEPDWAELSTVSGTGNRSSIILKYSENTSGSARSLNVVMTSGSKDYTCTLVQKPASSVPGPDPDPEEPSENPGWMELPAFSVSDGYRFVTHDMSIGGRGSRSYSLFWDDENLVAHWVAYPLNSWTIGSGSRTDEWAYDPAVPKQYQPRLNKGFSGGSYDRGHQIPSADRLEYNANVQTFYFTNMTPQLGSRFNQSIWANLENKVRSIAKSADTLYVVTGCVVKGSTKKAYDNDGVAVTVPTAYFKALLRYQKSGGTTGVGGYSAAAYYLEHKSYSQSNVDDSMLMSIDELEKVTGMDFFVNLPSKIGESNAAKVESDSPQSGIWL